MDIYQILVKHNHSWSLREIICFCIVLAVLCVVLGRLVAIRRIKMRQAFFAVALLVVLGIILNSTVFGRMTMVRSYELIPFWSWREVIVYHDMGMLQEIVLNIILLMPVGFLLPLVKNERVQPVKALFVGAVVSAGIEISQLVFMRGLFEWDDIIHNSLGCLIGCVLGNVVIRIMKMRTPVYNKRYLIWIFPVVVAVCIFLFSAQTGDESAQLSNGFLYSVLTAFSELLGVENVPQAVEMLSGIVRKLAHVSEYILLFVAVKTAFDVSMQRREKRWKLLSLFIVFLYACTDEIHQLFIPGRAGMFTDVLIDCSGAAVLSVLMLLYEGRMKQSRRQK